MLYLFSDRHKGLTDFQLLRKFSSGKSWDKLKHKEKFFLNQDAVNDFMASQPTKPVKEKITVNIYKLGNLFAIQHLQKKDHIVLNLLNERKSEQAFVIQTLLLLDNDTYNDKLCI